MEGYDGKCEKESLVCWRRRVVRALGEEGEGRGGIKRLDPFYKINVTREFLVMLE